MTYLVLVAVVFGVNLLPAFGPPTWTVLAAYSLTGHLNPVALVGAGAAAAVSGRLVLALACRRVGPHLGGHRLKNLENARAFLTADKRRTVVGLLLFALSPIPSAQLFEAAGLLRLPLRPVLAVFFAGRLVSYSIYVGGASAVRGTPLGDMVASSLTGWLGVAVQVVLLAVVATLAEVDLGRLVRSRGRRKGRRAAPPTDLPPERPVPIP